MKDFAVVGSMSLQCRKQADLVTQMKRNWPFDDDFLRLDATGIPHTGIIFSQTGRRTVGELIDSLMLIVNVIEPNEMKNHIEFI